MALSPTGVIPEPLMFPGELPGVLAFLKAQYIVGDLKVDYLRGWARAVGVSLNASQYASVRETGTDRGGPA